jgi:hypothetical protein
MDEARGEGHLWMFFIINNTNMKARLQKFYPMTTPRHKGPSSMPELLERFPPFHLMRERDPGSAKKLRMMDMSKIIRHRRSYSCT